MNNIISFIKSQDGECYIVYKHTDAHQYIPERIYPHSIYLNLESFAEYLYNLHKNDRYYNENRLESLKISYDRILNELYNYKDTARYDLKYDDGDFFTENSWYIKKIHMKDIENYKIPGYILSDFYGKLKDIKYCGKRLRE